MWKLFDYECTECGKIEEVLIESWARGYFCIDCGGFSKKIISAGHGGIQTDTNFSWLESASMVLVRPGEKPLKTRKEYNKYLKENGISATGGDAKIDGKYSMV